MVAPQLGGRRFRTDISSAVRSSIIDNILKERENKRTLNRVRLSNKITMDKPLAYLVTQTPCGDLKVLTVNRTMRTDKEPFTREEMAAIADSIPNYETFISIETEWTIVENQEEKEIEFFLGDEWIFTIYEQNGEPVLDRAKYLTFNIDISQLVSGIIALGHTA